LNFADKIIAVSQYTKNILVDKYGIDPNKIAVVHNAVNNEPKDVVSQGYRSSKEKIVLFLARMSTKKVLIIS
jgi:glycosyltransferase involved in cell wall biosynthesis